jgi:hypothetical protein
MAHSPPLSVPIKKRLQHRSRHAKLGGGFHVRDAAAAVFTLAEIRRKRMRQVGERERLQPDFPRAGQVGEEQAVAAEQHVLEAAHRGDLEIYAFVKHSNMAGMHAQHLTGSQVVGDDFAAKFDPGAAGAGQALQQEAIAAENARTERLLKAGGQAHPFGGANEAVLVDQVAAAGLHLDFSHLAGDFCREGDHAGLRRRTVFGHEQAAAGKRSADCT